MFSPYRIEALIGRGGLGEVHRAVDTVHDRVVAIERLPAALAADPEFQARFRAESASAARLNEPHIIPIHHYGEIDGRHYIDMRLVEGEDLAAMLARTGVLVPAGGRPRRGARRRPGRRPRRRAGAPRHQACERAGHPGADGTSDGEFVYIADFGIARAVSAAATSLTATGTTVGSLDYMAPRRFTGGHGDHRVDVSSLGCLLFEALTARKPFVGEGCWAGVLMTLRAVVVAIFTIGFGLLLLWPVTMVWGAVAAGNEHQKYDAWRIRSMTGR